MVFLHSSLSSSSQWLDLVKLLKDRFFCINIDLLGYGDAPQVDDPNNYTLNTEPQRIMQIITAQIGDADFTLVGHSFGGAVALLLAKQLAKQMGQRVSAMVLYEPVAFHLLDKGCKAHDEIMAVTGALQDKTATEAARVFVDYWNYTGFFDALPGKVQRSFAAKMDKVMLDFKGLIGQTYTLPDCDLAHCKTLVIEGKTSRLSAQTLVRQIAGELPDVE
ncbi:MAG: alpha/beta hydrolase, partial [Psychrosphaera sp.]|nr:alpha/beta hydrolase [Psychrosphaera sp.]